MKHFPRNRIRSLLVVVGLLAGLACSRESPVVEVAQSVASSSTVVQTTAALPHENTSGSDTPSLEPEWVSAYARRCPSWASAIKGGSVHPGVMHTLLRPSGLVTGTDCVLDLLSTRLPEASRRWPPPSDLPGIRAWWSSIGEPALRARLEPGYYVVAPELHPVLSGAVAARFAPLLCDENDGACGRESRTFFAVAEEQMRSLHEILRLRRDVRAGERLPANADERVAECNRRGLAANGNDAFAVWRDCVDDLVPRSTRAPRNAFRMPHDGVLVTAIPKPSVCRSVSAYSLATGLVAVATRCAVSGMSPVLRWELKQVEAAELRRAALLAALLPHMTDGPDRLASFRIPDGIREETKTPRGQENSGRVHDAAELHFVLHGPLTPSPTGRLAFALEREPRRGYLLRMLLGIDEAAWTVCGSREERARLQDLFKYLSAAEDADGKKLGLVEERELEAFLAAVECPAAAKPHSLTGKERGNSPK